MKRTTVGTLSLFPLDEEEETKAPAPGPTPASRSTPLGMRAAAARLVTTTSPDRADREQRALLLLVVDCPFCDHQHIHPAGHPGRPRVCPRRSRCVGRPTGAYYFPEVQR